MWISVAGQLRSSVYRPQSRDSSDVAHKSETGTGGREQRTKHTRPGSMVNQIPVPQAKYELLTDVRQPRWKTQVLCLTLIVGVLLVARAWIGILVLRSSASTGPEVSSLSTTTDKGEEYAQVAAWLRRAKMYAESSKENQNADRNTSVRYSSAWQHGNATRRILVCYYTISESLNPSSLGTSDFSHLPCTHLLLGFASLANCTIQLGAAQSAACEQAVSLKNRLPGLKVMLSVGGSNQDNGFSEMVRNHASRKKFIRSVLNVTGQFGLDGLDLDWEFPAWLGADEKERIKFCQLLQEMRKEFDRSGSRLLLSVAVAAPQAIVDQSYVVPQITKYADFVNLMSYDYHFYVWYYPVTGLNAPLFARSSETGYLSTLNVNFSAQYWLSKGLLREKLIIGIPTYGHSYKLDNPKNHALFAPANGVGIGNLGFVNYATVCNLLEQGAERVFDPEAKVPYCYKDEQWISYDDRVSVSYKAEWIKANGFGGAMILSLNVDDYNNSCSGNESFPLTRTVGRILFDEYQSMVY